MDSEKNTTALDDGEESLWIFDSDDVFYVPILDPKIDLKADIITPPTLSDIIEQSPFSPKKKKIVHYFHQFELRGFFNNNIEFPRLEGCKTPKRMKPKAWQAEGRKFKHKVVYEGSDAVSY